jgi:cytochrome c553
MRTGSKVGIAMAAMVFACFLASNPMAAFGQSPSQSQSAAITAAEAWAFAKQGSPGAPTASAATPNPHQLVHVAGSTRTYTQAQIDDTIPDWFPQDHPAMPKIVSTGHKPVVEGCGGCHLVNGAGVPSTAALAGLPRAYILEQIAAFRADERGVSTVATLQTMPKEARGLAAADLQLAADYFSKMKFLPHTRVIETATVPKTHWHYFVLRPDGDGARESLGERIIETPSNFQDYAANSDRVSFIAYVPPGSIERGAIIASQGVHGAQTCESCHGGDLQGVGNIPPLAGRSPTYIVRELILFRLGKRTNPGAAPMRAEVSRLTLQDLIDVAAYAGSRKS